MFIVGKHYFDMCRLLEWHSRNCTTAEKHLNCLQMWKGIQIFKCGKAFRFLHVQRHSTELTLN